MTERDDLIQAAQQFLTDSPRQPYKTEAMWMADFHLAQSSEITAERDRLREWVNGLIDIGWQDKGYWVSMMSFEDGSHAVMRKAGILAEGETPFEALTAYLKGKGDGDKG